MIDEHDIAHEVHKLGDDEHQLVVDECYQCKLCYVVCPYTPQQGQEWKVDFPRLMLRSLAIQHDQHKVQRGARLLARTDLQGKVATTFSPIVNRLDRNRPARVVIEKTTGISRERLLPNWAKVRFSKWFTTHEPAVRADASTAQVALFPTCLVEYQETAVGTAAVGVCERNGICCSLPEGEVCCGMPWLDAGDVEQFTELAVTTSRCSRPR